MGHHRKKWAKCGWVPDKVKMRMKTEKSNENKEKIGPMQVSVLHSCFLCTHFCLIQMPQSLQEKAKVYAVPEQLLG